MRTTPLCCAVVATALAFSAADAADFRAPTLRFGLPISGLTDTQQERFTEGKDAFEEVEVAADGLGPVFNDTSCAACHTLGGIGGASDIVETRFGTTGTDGAFDAMSYIGGSLIQTTGIGVAGDCDYVGELVPPDATVVAGRRTTSLFGLGLVDAVPDAYFLALSHLQRRYQHETAGRPNLVQSVSTGKQQVGKFGWKGQVANLFDFAGDAYLNEMGITTPFFPEESCPQGDCEVLACDPVPGVDDDLEDLELFRDFMQFLAPPPRLPSRSWAVAEGGRLFNGVGCANCHLPLLKTGPSPVKALAYRTFAPYSDFLLHDMGALGDGIAQGRASGRDMRTAPLWGVRLLTTLMHDGRARSLKEAILAHDGQGRRSRQRFTALSAHQQSSLLAFLGTL